MNSAASSAVRAQWPHLAPLTWSQQRSVNIFLIVAATYVAMFLPLYDIAGEGALNLFCLVTAVAGALLGLRPGLFVAMVGLLLHALPFGVLVEVDPHVVTPAAAAMYALAVLAPACGFGLMQEWRMRTLAQELAVRQQRDRLGTVMSSLPVVLFTLDRKGVFTLFQGRELVALDQKPGETVGQSIYERWSGREDIFDCVLRALGGETVTSTFDVGTVAFETTYGPIRDTTGAIDGVIAVGVDVTDRRRVEAELKRMAVQDPLTELPNRSLLVDRLDQALLENARLAAPVALLFLDVDRFKDVNESVGHDLGDQLLRAIGPRLQAELRPTDTIARLGGDEFAIAVPGIDEAGAALVARRLSETMRAPFMIGEHKIYVRASMGAAIGPAQGTDSTTLLRKAEVAMYGAKQAGTGYEVYQQSADEPVPVRLALTSDLRRAIERDELRLVFQPIVNCASGLATRFEALTRWTHAERGEISPEEFIPIAERAGLIKPLTEWVIAASLRQLRVWSAQGLDVKLSVNLSVLNLVDEELPARVAQALADADVPVERFGFEVTETTLMAEPERAARTIAALRAFGIALAIDDFGSGYSSLSYLHRLSISGVKIDKSFVQALRSDQSGRAIVQATIDLGHALGFTVVAEGVEDLTTLNELRRLGCDGAQGYHFAHPMPPIAVGDWLRSSASV